MLKEKIKTFDNDGQVIEGYRVIIGQTELRQIIFFNGKKELDSTTYMFAQKDTMMVRYAELIVWQMNSGRHI
jgi:hypothetical protein